MSTMTTPRANAALDAKYGTGTSGGWYIGPLSAIGSGPAGTVTEMTSGGASRRPISFAAASNRTKAQNADITFNVAIANNGNIVGWGLYSSASGGTPEHVKPAGTPIPYNTGQQPVLTSGSITVGQAAWSGS